MAESTLDNMVTANTTKRIMAYMIDGFIAGLCFAPVWMQLFRSYFSLGHFEVEIQWLFACLLLQFFYRWLFLYFMGGTIGKLMMGLRVVPSAHPEKDLSLMQSFLRVLTDGLSLFVGQALRAFALLRLDRTHVSDWVAETRVVQYVPRNSLPQRRFWLFLVVAIFSFMNAFSGIYLTLRQVHLDSAKIVFDAND